MKKILLLGSGELGKEFVISAQRKGNTSLLVILMPEHLLCKLPMNLKSSTCWTVKHWNAL